MINRKIRLAILMTVISFVAGVTPVKAAVCSCPATCACAVPTACATAPCSLPVPTAEQIALQQAAWNAYVKQAEATQAALSSSYADEILTLNRTALIDQAALIHHFAIAYPNPLTSQATADWAAVNMISSFNDQYAKVITCNPYFYFTNNCYYPR